jgi:hypothetical protein
MRPFVVLALALLTLAAPAAAQVPDSLVGRAARARVVDWSAVPYAVRPPQALIHGRIAAGDDSTLVLVPASGEPVRTPLAHVRRLDLAAGGGHRGGEGLVAGALIGGMAVALLAVRDEASCSGFVCFGAGGAAALGFAVGAPAGAVVGFLIGATRPGTFWERYPLGGPR